MKKSWSVILKCFKMHFNDQKCIHKRRKGEAATANCILQVTFYPSPVILYFSVFLSASTRLLELNCIDYICLLMLVTQIHFLRSTNAMARIFFTATNLSKTSCLKYHLTDHQLCIFCDMLRWKWKCQYPRKQTSRLCFQNVFDTSVHTSFVQKWIFGFSDMKYA